MKLGCKLSKERNKLTRKRGIDSSIFSQETVELSLFRRILARPEVHIQAQATRAFENTANERFLGLALCYVDAELSPVIFVVRLHLRINLDMNIWPKPDDDVF